MRRLLLPLTLLLPIPWGSVSLAAEPGVKLGDRLPVQARRFTARPAGKPATIFLWYADGTTQPEDGPYCTGLKPPAWRCNFGVSADDCQRQIQGYLDRWYADFNVVFTFSRPRIADYYTMIITSTNAWCSLNTAEAGVAPFNCNDNPGQSAFAFECGYDAHDCALIIAHEHAHMVGLDHTDSPSDLMFPNTLATIDGFEDRENRAPDALCAPKQNSYQRMLEQLGPWPGGVKPSPFDTGTPDGGTPTTPTVDAGKADTQASGGSGTRPIPASPLTDGGPPILRPKPVGDGGCAFSPPGAVFPWLAGLLPLAWWMRSRRRH